MYVCGAEVDVRCETRRENERGKGVILVNSLVLVLVLVGADR